MKRIDLMVSQMESDLKGLGYSSLTATTNCEKALECVKQTLVKIRMYLMQNGFKSNEDEIQFFKIVRPTIASKISLIAFIIEYMHTCAVSEQMKVDLINQTTTQFKQLMVENKVHVINMKRDLGENDLRFFIRNRFTAPVNNLGKIVLQDTEFLTYHSLLKEKILTQELIQNFLNTMSEKSRAPMTTLTWTGSKAGLIELMYSLYYSQAVNHGNLDVKYLTRCFEQFFNVQLGNVYRAINEIKNRNEPTIFLDKLKSVMENMIDEEDGFHPE